MKEYEKTISDLIAEKEGDKDKMEVNPLLIIRRIKATICYPGRCDNCNL